MDGTTFYACAECGACPCRHHDFDHLEACSHRVPDEWDFEDCKMFGPGRFVMCSRCARPPCRAEVELP